MGEFLTKEDLLFERNEKGEIMSITRELKSKQKIVFTPLPRGEWVSLVNSDKSEKDNDSRVLEKHLIKPKMSYDDLIKAGKPALITEIITIIITESNKTFEEKVLVPVEKKDTSMMQS